MIHEVERINLLKYTKFKIATWNIQGGHFNTIKCHQVTQEMKRLEISISSIQETKAQDIVYEEHPYGHILALHQHRNIMAMRLLLIIHADIFT